MLSKRSFRNGTVLALLIFGLLLGAAWAQTETVLYNLCAQTNCADGSEPEAAVVFGPNGGLFGTTATGGTHRVGSVFKLTAPGKETVLYDFCPTANCPDGQLPTAGLVFDGKGNLYGTASGGGNSNDLCGPNGCGVIFELAPDGKYTVLYSFCAQSNCADGGVPQAGMAFDQAGNLYGTTRYGGAFNNTNSGTVFKLTQTGQETVLYSFCSQGGFTCTDGQFPFAPVAFDKSGNLYGTTLAGGAYGYGVVFELAPTGEETTLYSYCARRSCSDGGSPQAGVVLDGSGNLYGTTTGGGAHSGGVVFKLSPAGKFTVLYSFCALGGFSCTDGHYPVAPLVFGQNGNLYGTVSLGGAYGGGAVFQITPADKYTILYNFCAQKDCPDGSGPEAGLILDRSGNLYGTTVSGGSHCVGISACGTVFKLTP